MNGDIAHSDPGPPSLPRKVTIQRGSEGYGFNLHGEKGIHGQFISAIDVGSPAQKNDLRVGDRVIAVNNGDVEDMPHSKVVERIRAGGNQVTLLVVDELCDQYYKNLGQKIPQDKFETSGQEAAVALPSVEENRVVNEGEASEKPAETAAVNHEEENVQNIQVESPEPEVVEEPGNAPEDSKDDADDDGYEEVIPKSKPEPQPQQIETEKPAEILQETKPAEQVVTTPPADRISNGSSSDASSLSPKLDMAAARPKPKRHDVKRATQNWKQKYDDFNKL
ncbi:Na(+)/H(+) exchange regulatory cofactor NHE-RF1-like [Dendronephthya gigantea]|uniref:Na(+)/H(+) exchange regulatory cofactor NHE-RF1-like n=1 Tax=Dendronephthya gigantea TaxID=151771 RepID=UPI00106DBD8C|nr:Na(+)/H(+) exchange regulatory cofactor NHE-RF1-like [Dendronephthya gigantea]